MTKARALAVTQTQSLQVKGQTKQKKLLSGRTCYSVLNRDDSLVCLHLAQAVTELRSLHSPYRCVHVRRHLFRVELVVLKILVHVRWS